MKGHNGYIDYAIGGIMSENVCNNCHFSKDLLPFDDTAPYEYQYVGTLTGGPTQMNRVALKIQQGKMEYFYCEDCENWRARNK